MAVDLVVTRCLVDPRVERGGSNQVRTIKHPLSGALYDLTETGAIQVSKDGRTGLFDSHGVWIEGEIKQADPHLCVWIAGKQLPNRFQQAAQALSQ
jgi:hypothetical protein